MSDAVYRRAQKIAGLLDYVIRSVSLGAMEVRGSACPYCDSSDVRRSHRVNLRERAAGLLGCRPFRCLNCRERYWAIHGRIWDGQVVSLIFLLLHPGF